MMRVRRINTRWVAVAGLLLSGGLLPAHVHGQERDPTETPRVVGRSIIVRVDGVAGSTIYINAGTGHALAQGDTFTVASAASSQSVPVVVQQATSSRSVLEFVDRPVPLTRGTTATLTPLGTTAVRLTEAWGLDSQASDAEAGRGFEIARARLPRPRDPHVPLAFQGRAYMDVTAMRSETSWDGGVSPGNLTRTFATPSLRLNGTLSNLPGGISVRTNLRSAYRYSDPSVVRATTIRVYEMAAEGTLPGGQFRVGRFFNPYESYSGYWDGGVVRMGGETLGFGAALGFQPDQWNEGLSSDLRKMTAFMDYRWSRGDLNWSGDFSVHRTDSNIGLPAHNFVGWSQDARIGDLRLSQDVQVDQDPDQGGWVVSRLQFAGVMPLSQRLFVNGRFTRRQPYSIYRQSDVFSTLRSTTGLGLTYSGNWGSVSGDAGVGSLEGMENSRNLSGSLHLRDPLDAGFDIGTSASYWARDESSSLSLSPSLTRVFGNVRGRVTYRFLASDSPWSTLRNHGGDVSLNVPLSQGWNWSVQAMGLWGTSIQSYRLHTGISAAFR